MVNFLESNIKKYYFTSALAGISLTTAISILYYLSFGLSFFEISLLESIFLITILLFEIPTGTIADKIGRKKAIVAGAALEPIATMMIGLGSSFMIFALAMVVIGIGTALMSGSEGALIYDTLREAQEEKSFIGINGKSFAIFFFCAAVVAPIGSHLFVINRRAPFFIDAIISLMALAIYMTMHEPMTVNHQEGKNFWQLIRSGIKQAVLNPQIRWYALFGILISLGVSVFSSLIGQPLILTSGISVANIGYVFTVSAAIQGFTSFYAEKIEQYIGEKTALLLIFLVPGIAFLAMSIPSFFVLIPFYMLYVLVKGFHYPVLGGYLQRKISSDMRATVLSTWSFIGSLSGALLLPVFGYIADRIPINDVASVLGLVILIGGTLLFSIRPRRWHW